ncbi:hypothetical protein OPT61_g10051 [Boeremia exigua]|uniref:Uncharacterized protein n=1 Tax=Boeremia exigua TaxID=749465 RepID=A0ACC2HRZ4_9PLEO|nr:hypothetical protein OPT61_g10051 [Boeremia exigua]
MASVFNTVSTFLGRRGSTASVGETVSGFFGRRGSTASIGESAVRALPGNWYTSEEMYQLERRAIFSRRWLLLTHKSRFAQPGDWLRYSCAGYDFVLIKDSQDEIRAFHNVCRHCTGYIVETGQGNTNKLTCKRDGCSYSLKGELAAGPEDLGQGHNGLYSIHVRYDANGYVWINMDSKDEPEVSWDSQFESVDKQERFKDYNFADYVFNHTWQMEGDFNWKLLADNYNECYHSRTTHPGIKNIADLEAYSVSTVADHIQHDVKATVEQMENGAQTASTFFFPNVSMTVTLPLMFMQKFMPSGPGASIMYYEVWRNKHASDEEFESVNSNFKKIMTEDKALCERAQRNMNSGVFVNGEMHPRLESGPLYFQNRCRETVMEHFEREKAAGFQIWPAT